jgi:flavin reductase
MSVESFATTVDLRAFAGSFPTGVAVITTSDLAGTPCGLTISALTSLSMEPPLFLICLNKTSNTLAALQESRRFCINLLSSEQAPISKLFASKAANKFDSIGYSDGDLGVPLIDGALAHAECTVHAIHDGGDHKIIIGMLESTVVNGGEPLAYFQSRYASLATAM